MQYNGQCDVHLNYRDVFQVPRVLETATPYSLWKLPNSSTGMDTISPGGEHPPFLTCGTSGSFQTPLENFIRCEDTQGTTRVKDWFAGTFDQPSRPCPSRTTPRDISGTKYGLFTCQLCTWVLWPSVHVDLCILMFPLTHRIIFFSIPTASYYCLEHTHFTFFKSRNSVPLRLLWLALLKMLINCWKQIVSLKRCRLFSSQ